MIPTPPLIEILCILRRYFSKTMTCATAAARAINIFEHAYSAYEAHAFGFDELRPLTNGTSNRWGGLAITMVDSLDTMLLMRLDAQFNRARSWLLKHYPERLRSAGNVPFFEITIRALGGLLSASTIARDPSLLDLAVQLGERLAPAISSSSTGIPFCTAHLALGNVSCPDTDLGASIPLAELGSVQLEFAALWAAMESPAAASRPDADAALRAVHRLPSLHGLYPSRLRPHTGGPASKEIGFGSGEPLCIRLRMRMAPLSLSLHPSLPPSLSLFLSPSLSLSLSPSPSLSLSRYHHK